MDCLSYKAFRHPWYYPFAMEVACLCLCGMVIPPFISALRHLNHDGMLFTFTFFPFEFFFIGLIFYATRTYTAEIRVDDEGIGWWVWGSRWRYIPWNCVKFMSVRTLRKPRNRPSSYLLNTCSSRNDFKALIYGFRFTDERPSSDELVREVRQQIQRRNIPFIDERKA